MGSPQQQVRTAHCCGEIRKNLHWSYIYIHGRL